MFCLSDLLRDANICRRKYKLEYGNYVITFCINNKYINFRNKFAYLKSCYLTETGASIHLEIINLQHYHLRFYFPINTENNTIINAH